MDQIPSAPPVSILSAVVAGACVALFVLATCVWAGVSLLYFTTLGINSARVALMVGLAFMLPWFGPWFFLWRRLAKLIWRLRRVREQTRFLLFLPIALVLTSGVSLLYYILTHP